jgi:PAS domain S-box-containing protein
VAIIPTLSRWLPPALWRTVQGIAGPIARLSPALPVSHSEIPDAGAACDAELLGALNIVYHNGSAGITVVDVATGRFLRVNRRYCDITGHTESELLLSRPIDVVHPDDRRKAGEGWRTALRGGGNWDSDIRYLKPDGSILYARITVAVCMRDRTGKPVRAASIIQDMTQSKRSDLLLRLSLQAGHIGSFHHDYKRNVFEISPELFQMYGFSPSQTLVTQDD